MKIDDDAVDVLCCVVVTIVVCCSWLFTLFNNGTEPTPSLQSLTHSLTALMFLTTTFIFSMKRRSLLACFFISFCLQSLTPPRFRHKLSEADVRACVCVYVHVCEYVLPWRLGEPMLTTR